MAKIELKTLKIAGKEKDEFDALQAELGFTSATKLIRHLLDLKASEKKSKIEKTEMRELSKTDRFANIKKAFAVLVKHNQSNVLVKQVPNASFFASKERNMVGNFRGQLVADFLKTKEVAEYIKKLNETYPAHELTSNFAKK